MKITFWSPLHGQTATTSNMLAISLFTGMYFKKKTLITHTHFNFNNLEAPLVEINSKSKNAENYFQGVGIDGLLRNFKASLPDKEMLENCCISFPNTNVNLLPGTVKNIREAYENEMEMIAPTLFEKIEGFTDILFIDASSGNNPLSKKLIDISDLTVINLCQSMSVLDNYFSLFPSFVQGKVFYLFGNYDSRSKYNIKNIQRKYRQINSSNSGVIPYNIAFKDSLTDGTVIDFIRDNINCSKTDENYIYINRVRSAAERILIKAGMNTIDDEGE